MSLKQAADFTDTVKTNHCVIPKWTQESCISITIQLKLNGSNQSPNMIICEQNDTRYAHLTRGFVYETDFVNSWEFCSTIRSIASVSMPYLIKHKWLSE